MLAVLGLFFALHQATLNYQNSTCTTATPCQLQVYRAVCPTPTTCPAWGQGSYIWTRISYGTASAKPTPTGTTWVVMDQDPALKDSTTYIYLATNSYQSAPTIYSSRGPAWIGTTSAGSATPLAPTVGANNSVN